MCVYFCGDRENIPYIYIIQQQLYSYRTVYVLVPYGMIYIICTVLPYLYYHLNTCALAFSNTILPLSKTNCLHAGSAGQNASNKATRSGAVRSDGDGAPLASALLRTSPVMAFSARKICSMVVPFFVPNSCVTESQLAVSSWHFFPFWGPVVPILCMWGGEVS